MVTHTPNEKEISRLILNEQIIEVDEFETEDLERKRWR
jgi:hypothetical protein